MAFPSPKREASFRSIANQRDSFANTSTILLLFFSQGLHPGAKYVWAHQIRLVGMMLVIFVKETHQRFVSEFVTETVGTGLMG